MRGQYSPGGEELRVVLAELESCDSFAVSLLKLSQTLACGDLPHKYVPSLTTRGQHLAVSENINQSESLF